MKCDEFEILTFLKNNPALVTIFGAMLAALSAIIIMAWNNRTNRKFKRTEFLIAYNKECISEIDKTIDEAKDFFKNDNLVDRIEGKSEESQLKIINDHQITVQLMVLRKYKSFIREKNYIFSRKLKEKADSIATEIDNETVGRISNAPAGALNVIFMWDDLDRMCRDCEQIFSEQMSVCATNIRNAIERL